MLSQKVIKTGGDMYYDPSFSGTLISDTVVDATTAGVAFTALEALSREEIGMLSGLTY